MKSYHLLLICFITLVSCQENDSSDQGKREERIVLDGGLVTGPFLGAHKNFCQGDSNDGAADGPLEQQETLSPLLSFPITLAGGYNWKPGGKPDLNTRYMGPDGSLLNYTHPIPSLDEAFATFQHSGDLFARVKVLPQPNPPQGLAYCYQRSLTTQLLENSYEQLKLTIKAYILRKTNINGVSRWEMDSNPTAIREVSPTKKNQCSEILHFAHPDSEDQESVMILSVENVKSNTNCLVQGEDCPSNGIIDKTECYQLILQVAHDQTHFFKGAERSRGTK
jgi:hypothetical protein